MKIIESFYNSGAFIANDPSLIADYEDFVKSITWIKNGTSNRPSDSVTGMLDVVQERIIEKYLSTEFIEVRSIYYSMWNGIESGSINWHSDLNEGATFSALYCLSTLNMPGGEFEIQSENLHRIKPTKYDLIIFSQKDGWIHRAIPYSGERIMLNFGFNSLGY